MRIKAAIDSTLCQQQAGFRKGRLCYKQIFTLRQIVEKITSLNIKLLVNFIDFRKAFDCPHRSSVWNILKSYGIPEHIVRVIRRFYQGSRCSVRVDGQLSDWFEIITGVRQGCLLSPLLFLIVMDWIMKQATVNGNCGLERLAGHELADLILLMI